MANAGRHQARLLHYYQNTARLPFCARNSTHLRGKCSSLSTHLHRVPKRVMCRLIHVAPRVVVDLTSRGVTGVRRLSIDRQMMEGSRMFPCTCCRPHFRRFSALAVCSSVARHQIQSTRMPLDARNDGRALPRYTTACRYNLKYTGLMKTL